jgi:hypothetical protein
LGVALAAVVSTPAGQKINPGTVGQFYAHKGDGTGFGGQTNSFGGGYSDVKYGNYWWYDDRETHNPWDPNNAGLPPVLGVPTISEYRRLDGTGTTAGTEKYRMADEPLGFQLPDSFWYFGIWYVPGDEIYISPDGWLSFDQVQAAPNPPASLPANDNVSAIIAPYWCDFQAIGSGGSLTDLTEKNCVYYFYDYVGQRLTVEWYQVKLGADPTKWFTFEAIMQFGGSARVFTYPTCGPYYSSHLIDVVYYDHIAAATWTTPANFVVGVEDHSETKGVTAVATQLFNPAASQRAVRFIYRRVYRYDMSAFQIISPKPGLYMGATFSPGMVLRYTKIEPIIVAANAGREIATSAITFRIDSSGTEVYRQNRNIFNLYPGKTDTTHFPCWGEPAGHRPGELGTVYKLFFDVSGYAPDECRDNDTFKLYSSTGQSHIPEVAPSCVDTLMYDWGPENYLTAWGVTAAGYYLWATGYPLPGPTSPTWITGGADWVYDLGDPGPDGVYGNYRIEIWSAKNNGCSWEPNARISKPSQGLVPEGAGLPGWNWVAYSPMVPVKTTAFPGNFEIVVDPFLGGPSTNYDYHWSLQGMHSMPYPFPHPCFSYDGFPYPARSATSYGDYGASWYPGDYITGPSVNWGHAAATHLRLQVPPLPPCYMSEPHDVATIHIVEPGMDYVQAESSYNCKSTIANYGYIVEPGSGFFYDHLKIDSAGTPIYHESTAINQIGWMGNPADDPDSFHVTYTPYWTPASGGDMGQGIPYDLTYYVKLGKVGPDGLHMTDHCPTNDAMKKTVTALWNNDVGTEAINEPPADQPQNYGSSVIVKAEIRNYGYRPEGPFDVELTVRDLGTHKSRLPTDTLVYSTIQNITFLDWRGNQAGNPDRVEKSFPAWVVPTYPAGTPVHNYLVEVRTLLPNDRCPANDFKSIIVPDEGVGVADYNSGPKVFELSTIKPNPFVTTTEIRYGVPVTTPISIKVYDITGKLVKTLVDGTQTAAFYTVSWNGIDDRGQKVGQGIYILRMETPSYKATKKFILLTH